MPGVLMLEALTQAGAWLVRASEDFAHSMVVLKQAGNVKYGQFVEPGQTLTVTAEILKRDERRNELKAHGTVDGRIIVSARLVLDAYNLADTRPEYAGTDRATIKDLRRQFQLLYQPEIPLPEASCVEARRTSDRDRRRSPDEIVCPCDLKARQRLVTGGSRGIGRACVARLAAEGRQGGLRLPEQPGRPPTRWWPS